MGWEKAHVLDAQLCDMVTPSLPCIKGQSEAILLFYLLQNLQKLEKGCEPSSPEIRYRYWGFRAKSHQFRPRGL